MRCKTLFLLVIAIIITFWGIIALPQAEEQKAHFSIIEEVVIKPTMLIEYEMHVREVIALIAKYEFPFPVYVYMTNDLHYIFAYPVENLADIENFYKAFGEMQKKMGAEKWDSLLKSAEGTIESYQYSVFRYMPELSYVPEEPRLKMEESNFIWLEYNYIKFGKEKEFEEMQKKLAELYKSKNITDGWQIYSGFIGAQMPLYVSIERAKDGADWFMQHGKINKLIEKEGIALKRKALTFYRKIDSKMATFRPDISYIPKKENSIK